MVKVEDEVEVKLEDRYKSISKKIMQELKSTSAVIESPRAQ